MWKRIILNPAVGDGMRGFSNQGKPDDTKGNGWGWSDERIGISFETGYEND